MADPRASSAGWLARVFERAERRDWCTKPWCTTCGAGRFRGAYLREAARRAGVTFEKPIGRDVRRIYDVLTDEPRARIYHELMRGLTGLDAWATSTDVFEVVLIDIGSPLLRWGVVESVEFALEGTPAGHALQERMERQAAWAAQRAQREEYERPETVEARREARRQAAAERHRERAAAARRRGRAHRETVARLTAMEPRERLEWLASRGPRFPLEVVPPGLVPESLDGVSIAEHDARALVELIDRRGGLWGRLARALRALVGEDPSSSPEPPN